MSAALAGKARPVLNAVYELESTGKVTVRIMTETFDTGSAAGRFFLTVLAGPADLTEKLYCLPQSVRSAEFRVYACIVCRPYSKTGRL